MKNKIITRRAFIELAALGSAGVTAWYLFKPKYNTIAHEFLTIEKGFGTEISDYEALDDIIDEAKKRIKVKEKNLVGHIVDTFHEISMILTEKGFDHRKNLLLNNGLKTKGMDSDNLSAVYVGIAEALNLPIFGIETPSNYSVRWHDKNFAINFEPASGMMPRDIDYQKMYNISDTALENGAYLRTLNREEFFSNAYSNMGHMFISRKDYKQAKLYFSMALVHNFRSVANHSNKGAIHSLNLEYDKAIISYKNALELDPGNPMINEMLKSTEEHNRKYGQHKIEVVPR